LYLHHSRLHHTLNAPTLTTRKTTVDITINAVSSMLIPDCGMLVTGEGGVVGAIKVGVEMRIAIWVGAGTVVGSMIAVGWSNATRVGLAGDTGVGSVGTLVAGVSAGGLVARDSGVGTIAMRVGAGLSGIGVDCCDVVGAVSIGVSVGSLDCTNPSLVGVLNWLAGVGALLAGVFA
jgi:hypothetical protein